MHKTMPTAAIGALSLERVAAFTSGVALGSAAVVLTWAILVVRSF